MQQGLKENLHQELWAVLCWDLEPDIQQDPRADLCLNLKVDLHQTFKVDLHKDLKAMTYLNDSIIINIPLTQQVPIVSDSSHHSLLPPNTDPSVFVFL